ncbi:MAG: aromatic aminobenezylarsenical efflux permease ArsG family transporter [Deltaproteobacteria bacterium]|jgi:cytochrome c-type biogenesis protein
MAELMLPLVSAFWLGVLTSISPCPLATNIVAISFVSRGVESPQKVLFSGLLYTAGRAATYVLLGMLLVASLLSAPFISHVLQKYMNAALGPLLILVGMVLLELISFNIGGGLNTTVQKRVEAMGLWGAVFLGVLFALSFCPTSAALFFGSLLPLAVNRQSGILLPAVYGVATGLPVLIFAVLLGFGANRLAQAYDRMVAFERWARRITGITFIFVGFYYSLTRIFGLSFI